MSDYRTCDECTTYGDRRMKVLAPAMADRMRETGETAPQILDRYMSGVHQRHLAGLPILDGAS